MKNYSEYFLQGKAARFVNKIWKVDNFSCNSDIKNMVVLPNGCFNIGLIVGCGATVFVADRKYELNQNIYLCSQFASPVNLTIKKHTKIILIQLHAWAFSYYKKNDFSNFRNMISESNVNNLLFNNKVDFKNPKLLEETISATEKHFSEMFDQNSKKNFIEEMIREIIFHKGKIAISQLINKNKYSQKWIQIQFKKATGLTPKQFAKIIQFRQSVDKIVFEDNKSFASISHEFGYTDQSHFIKNFNKFSSTVPSKFNPERFILSNKK